MRKASFEVTLSCGQSGETNSLPTFKGSAVTFDPCAEGDRHL
nr:MAG TPA: hypothetical protein [Herelleviridae sp.]